MTKQGKLFVFEGPDSVGKTTLAAQFAQQLNASGHSCQVASFPGRSKGTLGQLVYQLHHDSKHFGITSIHPTSLQMLHIAAHVDAIETMIVPTLNQGHNIVLDRFWWSTWAYGMVSDVNLQSLRAMIDAEQTHWASVQPTAVFLITRDTPLHESDAGSRWTRLCEVYESLAVEERKKYEVHFVSNHGSVDETVRKILAITGGF